MSADARARIPLNRSRVLDAAIGIADADGIDSVSMRGLAASLGVVPMALYKHVTDKHDLISGMIDTIVAAYPTPPAALPWADAVRWRIAAARREIARHPWLRRELESATVRTAPTLAYMDAVAGELVSGGLSVDLAHYAMHALGHRIWGFSPEPFADAPTSTTAPDPQAVAAMAAAFPTIAAIAAESARTNPTGACNTDVEFDFTLTLILDGIARLHETGWRSGSRERG